MSENQQSGGMLAVIERAAVNPDIDVHKMTALLDMQERIMARQAEIDFNTDMARLREELPAVVKNKKNAQTKSDYADLDAIKEAVDPILAKYGFYDRYEDDYPSDGVIGVTCEIVHKNGHSKRNRVQLAIDDKGIQGSVNKTKIHGTASSMTYGQRLSLCRALGVRISEDTDGNRPSDYISIEQAAEIDTMIRNTGYNRQMFLKYMQTDDVRNISKKDYQKAINALSSKANAGGK